MKRASAEYCNLSSLFFEPSDSPRRFSNRPMRPWHIYVEAKVSTRNAEIAPVAPHCMTAATRWLAGMPPPTASQNIPSFHCYRTAVVRSMCIRWEVRHRRCQPTAPHTPPRSAAVPATLQSAQCRWGSLVVTVSAKDMNKLRSCAGCI
eukprot:scaffold62511_cov40-Tisochrysis_lutea.AAC.1